MAFIETAHRRLLISLDSLLLQRLGGSGTKNSDLLHRKDYDHEKDNL
jgi:hypothetical protein